jgi:hypothetical protein
MWQFAALGGVHNQRRAVARPQAGYCCLGMDRAEHTGQPLSLPNMNVIRTPRGTASGVMHAERSCTELHVPATHRRSDGMCRSLRHTFLVHAWSSYIVWEHCMHACAFFQAIQRPGTAAFPNTQALTDGLLCMKSAHDKPTKLELSTELRRMPPSGSATASRRSSRRPSSIHILRCHRVSGACPAERHNLWLARVLDIKAKHAELGLQLRCRSAALCSSTACLSCRLFRRSVPQARAGFALGSPLQQAPRHSV